MDNAYSDFRDFHGGNYYRSGWISHFVGYQQLDSFVFSYLLDYQKLL